MIVIPIFLYLLLMLFIAYRVNKIKNNNNFTEEYFIGSRNMGGFVLAMTLVASYVGASSFIGGPAMAYKYGLSWVLLACIQLPTTFLTLGIIGKKLAIISRKIKSVTLIEILKARYNSNFITIFSSLTMLIFFVASIVAQFVGGARLFESITGYSYSVSLFIFALVVICYTSFGGFRAVVITDAIQGVVMLVATVILFVVIVYRGNGMENIMRHISETSPELLTPTSSGQILKPFILSFWILVGIGVLGYPSTIVRCMAFKDSKSLHNAMIIGTSVVGILMIGMHLIGVMGVALSPNIEIQDKIIPTLALKNLHPILAGIFIGGPLAAIMSSVDSILIMSSATIVKDLYVNYINKNSSMKTIRTLSIFTSFGIGVLVFLLALNPKNPIVFINLFALAGLETIFFTPIILGLFWKRGNATGAVFSMLSGFCLLLILTVYKISVLGLHFIVPVLAITIITFVIGSYFGEKTDEKVLDIFFNL